MTSPTAQKLDRLEEALRSVNAVVQELGLEASRRKQAQEDLASRVGGLESAVGRLSELIGAAADETQPHVDLLAARIDNLAREVGRLGRLLLLATHNDPAVSASVRPAPELGQPMQLSEQFGRLQSIVPRTFGIWKGLLEHNEQSYTGFPVHSCSVAGHPSATMFTSFVNRFLRGHVLDIGCGPQPVPLYLQKYPVDRIYGIDPISTADRHPFHFYRGVAEFLPWDDASFDVVIAATSLDHVLLLDKALREIHRVLNDDGEFLVWVAFVAGSAPYDPMAADIEPVDEYHLFHFTEESFEAALSGLFLIKDKLRANLEIDHHFYRLAKLVSANPSSSVDNGAARVEAKDHPGDD